MSIWKHLFNLEERRNWWTRKMPDSPLLDYYETPFPNRDLDWRQVDYLALDFETTGLEAKQDQILSVGYATIKGDHLLLSSATHILARPTMDIPEASAVVHGILDDEAGGARKLEEVLPIVLNALKGKALLAHHAAIEYEFLNNACMNIYGFPFLCPVVDTLALEVRQFRMQDKAIRSGDLRLAKARARYGLPRYPAHNALTDALAAGELFLAQVAYRRTRKPLRLKDLVVVS
ncbi:MAG: exonuclease domain-containing protein [Sedimenticola sp.]|nr:exonuclease domain-containing protein [Sedimenticola sp.]MCW8948191.1 exonuclease domain-containing protein [Sedimenticola sp.]MCW8949379.1 exonuclease domain-containing protein [Sedimenticola sp.]